MTMSESCSVCGETIGTSLDCAGCETARRDLAFVDLNDTASLRVWPTLRGCLFAIHSEPDGRRLAYVELNTTHLGHLIRAVNGSLPDDDPRKVTREKVDLVAEIAKEYRLLQPLADALESYLPPP